MFAAHSAVQYKGIAKELVWKLKFGRARAAANEISEIMALHVPLKEFESLIVTHVPTAPVRVRQRGYDQAALIAKAFARRSGLPHSPLLARQLQYKQVGASRAVRLQQLHGAFRPVHSNRIQNATVLLVDDVVTTGATLQASAAALKAAGAKRVIALTFAQA